MPYNPILEELHKTRERLLADAGGTMAGLVAQLQKDQRDSGREILNLSGLPRRRRANQCAGAADSAVGNPLSPSTDR